MSAPDLLHRDGTTPLFVLDAPDSGDAWPVLMLTVEMAAVRLCEHAGCSRLHIRVGPAAPPSLRMLAATFTEWAERLERLQHEAAERPKP